MKFSDTRLSFSRDIDGERPLPDDDGRLSFGGWEVLFLGVGDRLVSED